MYINIIDYMKEPLWKQKGFKSNQAYRNYQRDQWLKKEGKTTYEYKQKVVAGKGYKSTSEYERQRLGTDKDKIKACYMLDSLLHSCNQTETKNILFIKQVLRCK